MKKLLFCALIAILPLVFQARAFGADETQARMTIDNLYRYGNALPITDLVIDLEESSPPEGQGGGQTLEPTSKDKIIFKKPNKIRIDALIIDPGGAYDQRQNTVIRDGTNCWLYVSAGQYPVKKKADEPSPPLNIPFNVVIYPQDASRVYTSVGEENLDKVQVSVIRIVSPASPQDLTTVWVDKTRMVPLKLELSQPSKKGDSKPVKKTVLYKEIKQLPDGRYFPNRLEIYFGDALQRLLVYTGVSVNVGIEDNIFEPMSKFLK